LILTITHLLNAGVTTRSCIICSLHKTWSYIQLFHLYEDLTKYLNIMPLQHSGWAEVKLQAFLTSAVDRGVRSASSPGIHWRGGWVGPRAGLEGVVKIKNPCSCQEPNASCPAHSLVIIPNLPRTHLQRLQTILAINVAKSRNGKQMTKITRAEPTVHARQTASDGTESSLAPQFFRESKHNGKR
jgi:hypothetical protein